MRAADALSFDFKSSQSRSARQIDPDGSEAAATKDVDELLAHDAIAVSRRRRRRAARG